MTSPLHYLAILPLLLFLPANLNGQSDSFDVPDPATWFPAGSSWNSDLPTPADHLGWDVGTWHITHDQLASYMRHLAELSDRIELRQHSVTHGGRAGLTLIITSPDNHTRLEEIRRNQQRLTDPALSRDVDLETMPVVVSLGYSIHGNEPSGANASMIVAWHLAAAESEEIESLLEESVILLDPSLNPDGLQRFSTWVNMHRGHTPTTDPRSLEFNEPWPTGRTNYYWFDLNRDWLPVQHPVSRGRVLQFHHWRPNVFADFHEMGEENTYFFQPGVPSRTWPLTPQRNQELTSRLATRHAEALEETHQLFYSEETFDDFYIGKGSTYPDVQGAIGILFEQGSSRGHLRESSLGLRPFHETIRNQVTTSLSTLRGAQEMRIDLLEWMRTFYQEAVEDAGQSPVAGHLIGDSVDSGRNQRMLEMLLPHQIDVRPLEEPVQLGGTQFQPGQAWFIPNDQPQSRLVASLFARPTTFQDSLFYDVSAWTLPLATNLPWVEVQRNETARLALGPALPTPGSPYEQTRGDILQVSPDMHSLPSAYSYLIPWTHDHSPALLYRLQEAGIRARVATTSFTARTPDGRVEAKHGSILIHPGIQEMALEDVTSLLERLSNEFNVPVHPISEGLTPEGVDLGSPSFRPLQQPSVALLTGEGVSSEYEAGEVWHLLNRRMKMPLSRIDVDQVHRTGLNRYTSIVMVSGSYSTLSESGLDTLRDWIRQGGTLILIRGAVSWAIEQELIPYSLRQTDEDPATGSPLPYASMSATRGADVIGGAIFSARIDTTHPLGYGYQTDKLHTFRNSTIVLDPDGLNRWSMPLTYEQEPLVAGYVSDQHLENLRSTPAIAVSSIGQGRVIAMTDNPNFRGFWIGTEKLFLNALFFGHTTHEGTVNE
ncbi:MAG: M14 family zinc carboxypeptidase [Balneolaceae bacterium]